MAGRIILVTGGARSGKSAFAESLAAETAGKKTYIATAEIVDDEMRRRIEMHRLRRPADWRTVEVPRHLVQALPDILVNTDVILLDCLTVYVATLLYDLRHEQGDVIERIARSEVQDMLRLMADSGKVVIAVTNEVGSGIVPGDAVSRLYRDVAGMVNQSFAAAADNVYLTVAGIAVEIKGRQVCAGEYL